MVPSFADVLDGILLDLLERIILKDVFRIPSNLYQLVQIDLSDKNIRKSATDIDTGFAARIKVEQSNVSPNDPKLLTFKKEAGKFLYTLLRLLEKSPLKYVIV